jgi:hypothetical protein
MERPKSFATYYKNVDTFREFVLGEIVDSYSREREVLPFEEYFRRTFLVCYYHWTNKAFFCCY